MQTVSAALVLEQQLPDQKYYRHVELLKRYWTGSAFAWETATNIDEYVIAVSTAKWKRDERGFSEWKSPSFQVEVSNPRNLWNEVERRSIWANGLHSGYIAELSKVRVRVGHVLEDGTEQDLYVFGGVIKQPLAFHKKRTRTATIYCAGLDELLKRVDAEALSTTVTDELLGSDAGTEFTADFNGVARFTAVKKGQTADGAALATTLTPSTDYNTADENEIALPGKVTLNAALIAGQSVWASYFYWYQDKEPSWIVEQLLLLAGITGYVVEPTIFTTAVENTWLQTLTADWAAGTLLQGVTTNGDSLRGPVLIDDFSDGDFTANPVWTPIANYSIAVAGGKLTIQNGDNLYTPFDKATGTWQADLSASLVSNILWWDFLHTAGGNCYSVGLLNGHVVIAKDKDLSPAPIAYMDWDHSIEQTYRITRDAAGEMNLYIDGVLKLTATDNDYTTSERIEIECTGFTTQYCSIDNMMWSPEVTATGALTTGIFESQVKDTLVGQIDAWGKLLTNYGLNGGTILVETYTSAAADFLSGNDAAGWVALSGTGQILSAVLRYIKVRVTITRGSAPGQSPEFQDYSVKYYTTSTKIPLVDLSHQNVLAVIQDIAGMAAYEFGFTASEQFFYRARSTASAPVLVINKDNYLKEELSYNKGTDKVFTAVEANFGEFAETIDANTQGEAHPNVLDKYGRLPISVSSDLLPGPSVNVARSAAQTLYAYVSVARDRAQLEVKMLVQLELGDVITYQREHEAGRWVWGDTERAWGGVLPDEDFEFYSDAEKAAWDIDMRIEGIEFITDPKKVCLRYDLVRNI